jgi:hypothetical protein
MIVVCRTKGFRFLDSLHAGMTGKTFEGIQGNNGLFADGVRPIQIVGLYRCSRVSIPFFERRDLKAGLASLRGWRLKVGVGHRTAAFNFG